MSHISFLSRHQRCAVFQLGHPRAALENFSNFLTSLCLATRDTWEIKNNEDSEEMEEEIEDIQWEMDDKVQLVEIQIEEILEVIRKGIKRVLYSELDVNISE